jgi:hypothetical protein
MIVNLLDIVNQRLVEKAVAEIESRERDYTHFHPSEWDGCKRKIAYAYYEAKDYITIDRSALKLDPQGQRIFDNGHSMHARWRKYLGWTNALIGRWMCKNWMAHPDKPKIYGVDEKLGVPRPQKCDCGSTRFEYIELGFLDMETMWGGHVDAIIDNEVAAKQSGYENLACDPDERFVVVDFKTINDFDYGKKLENPKPEHITQMQIYLYLSGLKYGKFLYENKNNQAVKEFLVTRDDKLLEVKKAEALALKVQVMSCNSRGQRTLPKRGFDSKTHYQCMRCKFRGDCWNGRHDKRRKETRQLPQAIADPPVGLPTVGSGIGELDV